MSGGSEHEGDARDDGPDQEQQHGEEAGTCYERGRRKESHRDDGREPR